MGSLDTVTLQVVPFKTGAYGTLSGSVSILTFADAQDPPLVYLEYPGGGVLVENKVDVGRYAASFDGVAAAALTPDDTAALIKHRLSTLEDQ